MVSLKDTQDCAQLGVEALWWSFYLVWKPSSQEVPGPCCVLSAPSPKQWDAIGYHVYQTSSYWLLERSNQFTILLSLLCGPWENPVGQPVVTHVLLHSLLMKCLWVSLVRIRVEYSTMGQSFQKGPSELITSWKYGGSPPSSPSMVYGGKVKKTLPLTERKLWYRWANQRRHSAWGVQRGADYQVSSVSV